MEIVVFQKGICFHTHKHPTQNKICKKANKKPYEKHTTKYTKFTLGEHHHHTLFFSSYCEWGRSFLFFIHIFQQDTKKKSSNNAENMPLWDAYSDTSFFFCSPHLINILILLLFCSRFVCFMMKTWSYQSFSIIN